MNVPKSPIELLEDQIKAHSAIKGFADVYLGPESLSKQSKTGRIVLIPTSGQHTPPHNKTALYDLNQQIVAHIWGDSYGHAWNLYQRCLQAIKEARTGAGLTWEPQGVDWDTQPDTTKQGRVLEVTFTSRIAVTKIVSETSVTINTVAEIITNT